MDVPVDDGDTVRQPGIESTHHTDAHVVEDAEAATPVALRVMPRWPNERVRVVDVARRDGGDRCRRATDSETGHLGRPATDRRELAGVTARGVTELLDTSDVLGSVEPQQISVARLLERNPLQLRGDVVRVEKVLQLALGLGVLQMNARFEIARHLVGARCRPVEVPHQALVPHESGRHRAERTARTRRGSRPAPAGAAPSAPCGARATATSTPRAPGRGARAVRLSPTP